MKHKFKLVLVFSFLLILSGCIGPINDDKFWDYVPWWATQSIETVEATTNLTEATNGIESVVPR